MEGTYHVVCHDCTLEGVYADRGNAVDVHDSHEAETDHRISFMNIAGPTARANP